MTKFQDLLPGLLKPDYHRCLRAVFLQYDVTMISCLYWRHHPSWRVAARTCMDSFFVIPVIGKIRIHLDGKATILSFGKFLMLPENRRHAMDIPKGSGEMEAIVMHCQINDRWGRPLLSRFPSPYGQLPDVPDSVYLLKEISYLMMHDQDLAQQRGSAVVKELLAWQLRRGVKLSVELAEGDSRISRVIQIMEEKISSPDLSVEDLADAVRITPSQLLRLFRRQMDTGPKHYLHTMRLRKASHLLRHTTNSVTEIAAVCGFSSDHYFHLTFRKAFGCTPSAYRGDV